MMLTVTRHIKAREFPKVGAFKALVVFVHSSHDSGPRPPENLQHKGNYTKLTLVERLQVTMVVSTVRLLQKNYR